jgi:hypothetical protein
MKKTLFVGLVLAAGAVTSPAFAGDLIASGVLTATPDGSDFNYTISLTNSSSSTVPLGTFWFGWVPGKDFMPTAPIPGDFISPAGWTENVTHGGSSDGYAIQWVSGGTASDLAPGSSLTFGFTSATTPSQLAGDSSFYPTFPTTTSFVYQGTPFSGLSDQFVVGFASIPEPGTFVMGTCGVLAAGAYVGYTRRRRKEAQPV